MRRLQLIPPFVLFMALSSVAGPSPAQSFPGDSPPPAPAKPNIVLILADDIGYGDLSCYGATLVKTPTLDRLAREGCRFTDAHSPASTCTPTRRALLTGGYSWRQQPGSTIAPGDAAITIQPGTVTLPSLLKQAGYRTGIAGKWHLGLGGEGGPDWNADIKPSPLDLGFDSSFIMAATGDRVPCVYIRQRRIAGLDPADPITVSYKKKIGTDPTGAENPELLTTLKHTHGHDRTIVNGVGRIGWMSGGRAARWRDQDMSDTFAREAVNFINGGTPAASSDPDGKPGSPAAAPASGPEAPFFLFLATHGIHVPRVPHERFAGTTPLGARGDAIRELDDCISQVVAALEKRGVLDNTLILFTSDNGGVWDDGYADHGPKGTHAMNGALRGTKGTLYEGGHRVPFIARWPGHIKASTESSALMVHVDLPATLAALTGVPLPDNSAPDSLNLLPALLGQEAAGRSSAVFHVGGTQGPFALRMGQWKYIEPGRSGYGLAPAKEPQLYDLASDPGERTNLVPVNPDKVKECTELLAKTRAAARTRP